ncbi:hypothetical protein MPSEU_000964400 [Mayamaea pseudoterrestris]|nr:hypothetical protein MPSEU_000964400 [Mayamaea pseudoterrestris]
MMRKALSFAAVTAAILGAIAFLTLGGSSSNEKISLSNVRRKLNSLSLKGDNGNPGNAFPLGECQGDCDSDNDCDGDLVCHQRDDGEEVPGCSGVAESNWDYCIRPPTYTSTSPPEITTETTITTEVKLKGNDGSPSSAFPLGLCQGDCDSDSDCATGLTCFQRSGGDAVPGCSGGENDNSNSDYCIDPYGSQVEATVAPTQPLGEGSVSETFGLKIYWEQGYRWQDETFERKWCLRCDSDNQECSPGRRVYITDCDTDMISQWQFLYLPDETSFFWKLVASDLCITVPSNTQDRFTVEYCDSNNERQLFTTTPKADWSGPFEIHPVWASDGCVANTHHPKFGEALYLWRCEVSEASTTSQWNFY